MARQSWNSSAAILEGALVVAAVKAGFDPASLDEHFPRLGEIAFSPERRRMTTLHETAGTPIAYSKGASEAIVGDCINWLDDTGEPAEPFDREAVREAEKRMASKGLRVLGDRQKGNALAE